MLWAPPAKTAVHGTVGAHIILKINRALYIIKDMLFISTACPASRLMYDGYNTGMYEYDVMYVCIMRHNLVHKYFYQIMMHYTYMHHWLAGM
jgi:hypothetical protein